MTQTVVPPPTELHPQDIGERSDTHDDAAHEGACAPTALGNHALSVRMTACLCVQRVGGHPGKWINIDWGNAKLTPTSVTIPGLYSALRMPLQNLHIPEKQSKQTKGQI